MRDAYMSVYECVYVCACMCVLDIHVYFHYKFRFPVIYEPQSQETYLKINSGRMKNNPEITGRTKNKFLWNICPLLSPHKHLQNVRFSYKPL